MDELEAAMIGELIAKLAVCGTCGEVDKYFDYEDWWFVCPFLSEEYRRCHPKTQAKYPWMIEWDAGSAAEVDHLDSCHFAPPRWIPFWEPRPESVPESGEEAK